VHNKKNDDTRKLVIKYVPIRNLESKSNLTITEKESKSKSKGKIVARKVNYKQQKSVEMVRKPEPAVTTVEKPIEEKIPVDLFLNYHGVFTDVISSNEYSWVKINGAIWMAEDLKIASGAELNGILESDNRYYYTWKMAKNACPMGWHLPTDKEWFSLESYIDRSINDPMLMAGRGYNIAEKLVSSESLSLQVKYNGHFITDNNIVGVGSVASYWTATTKDKENAWFRKIDKNTNQSIRYFGNKNAGFSVRCVKN